MIAGFDRYFQIVPLLPRRGPARRSPAGVHADRRRDVVRHRRARLRRRRRRDRGDVRGGRARRSTTPFPRMPLRRGDAASTDRTSRTCGRAWRSRTSARRSPSRRSRVFRERRGRRRRRPRLRRPGGATYSRKELDDLTRAGRASSARAAWSGCGWRRARFRARRSRRPARPRCEQAFDAAGGARGRPAAARGRRGRRSSRACSGSCACTSRKRGEPARAGRLPVRVGHRVSAVRVERRTRSAGTRCTIRSRRRGREDVGAARVGAGSRARARVRPGAQRLGDRRRQHPDPSRRRAAAGVPPARHLGRGRAARGSASSSTRSSTARRRTAASRSASIASWRCCAARRRSARSSRSRRPRRRSISWPARRRRSTSGSCASCRSRRSRRLHDGLRLHVMRLGIDLGGTKIAAVVLADDGRVVWERARRDAARRLRRDGRGHRAPRRGGRARGRRSRCTVGIGIPGAISPATGLVKNANSTWLNGRPLQQDLERAARRARCGSPTTRTAWRCPKRRDGAAAGARVVFGVILGTGTGGGVVVGGEVMTGANAIAGEWGHNPLPWPEDDERPGPDVLLRPARLHRDVPVRARARGRLRARAAATPCGARTIVARAAAARRWRRRALDAWERRLARALATIINVLDPDVIVVGGGLSRIARLYDGRAARSGARGCSRIASRRGSCRRGTATPAASAAPRGCGSRTWQPACRS